MKRPSLGAWTVAAVLLAAGIAPAQPDDAPHAPPPDRERGPAGGPPHGDILRRLEGLPPAERRARLREFLMNRLARMERTREAIDSAIAALDRGESVDEVARDFPPELRQGGPMGAPPGPGAPGGPDGRRPGMTDRILDDLGELGPSEPGRPPRDSDDPAARPRPRRPGASLTDEERRAVEEFLASAAPGAHRLLMDLRERDPAEADRRVREALPRIRWLLDLRERQPELYRLRLSDIRLGREALEAARALARHDREQGENARGPERQRLVRRLRSALESQYEVRGQILQAEVKHLEEELGRKRTELARRDQAREDAITAMLDRINKRGRDWFRQRREHGEHDAVPHPGGDARPDREVEDPDDPD